MIIEDSDEDFETLSRIIDRVSSFPIDIQRCIDGDDALDFLNKEGKYSEMKTGLNPELILLDLNLPGTDGREVRAISFWTVGGAGFRVYRSTYSNDHL